MAILLQDDFNRADNASSPGTPPVGGPYTAVTGTWGINGNALGTSASVTAGVLTFPAAFDVDLSARLSHYTGSSTAMMGLIVRYRDASNYWLARGDNSGYYLQRRFAGSLTNVGVIRHPRTSANPLWTTYETVRLVAVGSSVRLIVTDFYGVEQYAMAEDTFSAPGDTSAGVYANTLAYTNGAVDDILAKDGDESEFYWGGDITLASRAQVDDTYGDITYNPSLYKGRDTALQDEGNIP